MESHLLRELVPLHDQRERTAAVCSCGEVHPYQKDTSHMHTGKVWDKKNGVFVNPKKQTSESEYWKGTGCF